MRERCAELSAALRVLPAGRRVWWATTRSTSSSPWWLQRLTSLALIPLTVWFAAAIVGLAGSGYEEFVAWLSDPCTTAVMVGFLAVTFHHAQSGMQVVIEDYVQNEKLKLVTIMANNFFSIAVALAAINVAGGFLVTRRMLEMFKKKKQA